MILGLHHAALAVPNLEAALAFYCELLGFEIVMEATILSCVDVMSGALGIDDSGFRVRMIRQE